MIARVLYYASFVVIALTVTLSGVHMWRDARRQRVAAPAILALAPGGYVASDRLHVERHGTWAVTAPFAIDSLEVADGERALVIGHATDGFVAFDLATGRQRVAWRVPAGEQPGLAATPILGCIIAGTMRDTDALVRCIDTAAGTVRWTATIPGGRECTHPPLGIASAVIVQCAGWTTVIDVRTGAVTVDAGGLSLIQREPALLLRAGSPLSVAAWTGAQFAKHGTPIRGTSDFLSQSAVMRRDRLVMRAASSADQLALVSPKQGEPIVIASELRLAGDTPFVRECGGPTSPRFQLVELAPKLGETFDPDAARRRALALIDVDAGIVAWTSQLRTPSRPATPVCRGGHWLVEVEDSLWIVDAETGKTTGATAFEGGLEPARVDADRLAVLAADGVRVIAWRAVGMSDRPRLERVLGPLP